MREKGLMEEDWNDRSNWRKKILQIIVKWAQEDVETFTACHIIIIIVRSLFDIDTTVQFSVCFSLGYVRQVHM